MKIVSFTSSKFQSNAYLIVDRCSRRSVVVDMGDDTFDLIKTYIHQEQICVDYILLTHEHIDHIIGVDELRVEQECSLVSSQACSAAIIDPSINLSKYWGGEAVACSPADVVFEEIGCKLAWCDSVFRFFLTPGHSVGSACIALEDCLFSGDTLLGGLKTVTKLPGSDKAALAVSLRFLFDNFSESTTVYPGHGTPFSLHEMNCEIAMGIL